LEISGLALGMPKRLPHSRGHVRHFFREWRDFRNLSQERAADRIGIDRSHLSKIESGKSEYNQAFLEKAADAYLCDPADLLVRNPLDKSAAWTLYDAIKKASPEKRASIIAVVETLLNTGT
jgi:transcriptional regulator with XRE-family HTH domain